MIEAPWQSEAGRAARAAQLRQLADGDGEFAEYAREVLAGRVGMRALVYSSILSDDALSAARDAADAWQRLPADQQSEIVASATEDTWARIDALTAKPAPPPDPDDDDGPRTFLTDAW